MNVSIPGFSTVGRGGGGLGPTPFRDPASIRKDRPAAGIQSALVYARLASRYDFGNPHSAGSVPLNANFSQANQ